MSSPRRNIVLPQKAVVVDPAKQRKIEAKLDQARAALKRWQARLQRAFNTVEKHQTQIARLEKQLHNLLKGGKQ